MPASLWRLALAAPVAAALAGCTVGQWYRPYSTQADFERDLAQCDIMVAPENNIQQPVPLLAGLGRGLTDGEKYCLRDMGWKP